MLPHPGRGDGSARLGGQTAVSGVRTQGTDLRLSCREGQMASKTERTIINAAGLAPGVVLVTDATAVIARGKDGGYHVQTSHRPLGCRARAGACSGVSMAAD
jgi:hypothetical protein